MFALAGCLSYDDSPTTSWNAHSQAGIPVKTRLRGGDSGFRFFFIGTSPSEQTAIDNLYAAAEREGYKIDGSPYAFQNMYSECSGFLYPVYRIRVSDGVGRPVQVRLQGHGLRRPGYRQSGGGAKDHLFDFRQPVQIAPPGGRAGFSGAFPARFQLLRHSAPNFARFPSTLLDTPMISVSYPGKAVSKSSSATR